MLQVKKSGFCGISALLKFCFMSERQVLMTVSDDFFSGDHSLEVGFTFHWESITLKWGGSTLWGTLALRGGGGLQKKLLDEEGCLPCHQVNRFPQLCNVKV